jgi:hypothetical protein
MHTLTSSSAPYKVEAVLPGANSNGFMSLAQIPAVSSPAVSSESEPTPAASAPAKRFSYHSGVAEAGPASSNNISYVTPVTTHQQQQQQQLASPFNAYGPSMGIPFT